jgi:hypothetical protein
MRRFFLTVLLLNFFLTSLASAQGSSPTSEEIQSLLEAQRAARELPELTVNSTRPWLYAEFPGVRILSLLTQKETAQAVQRLRHHLLYIPSFLPDGKVPALPEPALYVFVPLDLNPPGGKFISRYTPRRQWLTQDTIAVYEAPFSHDILNNRFVPAPPTGGNACLRAALWQVSPNDQLAWYTPSLTLLSAMLMEIGPGSATLVQYPLLLRRPGTPAGSVGPPLIPLSEFFAATSAPSTQKKWDPVKVATLKYQTALFCYWGFMADKGARRDRFHRFAAAASRQPVSEALFREHFGLSYAEAEAQLEGPVAKSASSLGKLRLRPNVAPGDTARVAVRPATAREIKELLGALYLIAAEAEPQGRRAAAHLRRAQTFLIEALADGGPHPGISANLGFTALAQQDYVTAERHLEEATRGGIARARAYVELARTRYIAELKRTPGPRKILSAAQVEYVLAPLEKMTRPAGEPRLDLELEIDVYAHSHVLPSAERRAEFDAFARRHPHAKETLLCVVFLHALAEDKPTAESLFRYLQQWNSNEKQSTDPVAELMDDLDVFKAPPPPRSTADPRF